MTVSVPPADTAKYLDAEQAAARFGISARHWRRLVDAGKAPQPVRLGASVRWSIDALQQWESRGCPPVRALARAGAQ